MAEKNPRTDAEQARIAAERARTQPGQPQPGQPQPGQPQPGQPQPGQPRSEEERAELRNEDPITGAAGSHPVGSGAGAAVGGAAAGAAAGAVAGPVGTVAGAVIGGVAGGLAGKAIAENVDPTVETDYWRDEHRNRPYYDDSYTYDEHYAPAYRAGWEAYDPDVNEDWPQREQVAQQRWEDEGGAMSWEEARPAAEDAYVRVRNRSVNKPR